MGKINKKELAYNKRLEEIKLISEFMGCRLVYNPSGTLFVGHIDMFNHEDFDCTKKELKKMFNDGHLDWQFVHQDALKYDSDWEFIMDIVTIIETLGFTSTIEKMYVNYEMHRVWFNDAKTYAEVANGSRHEDKKQAVYEAVVDFINWYNRTNEK
jgi:hypothetical protein